MLAKQAWCVINNPESLCARIFKAKYFPEESFWTVEPHASPSYSWRSIFSTRELLRQGTYWQIGDGTSVNVWTDSWIPGVPDYRPTTGTSAAGNISLVCELFDQTRLWNARLIRDTFTIREAEAILSIPLSSREVDDRVVWRLEKNGKYTVKTAYQFSFATSPSRQPFELPVGVQLWKKLWSIDVPNSSKVHIWRICHDILPSKESLVSKKVDLDSTVCLLCNMAVESTIHICRDCSYTKQLLQTNAVVFQVCYNPHFGSYNILGWLSACIRELSIKSLGELVYLLWSVWKERNNRVWEDKASTVCDVLLKAVSRLQDFRFYTLKESVGRRGLRMARWAAPPAGYFKINVDGSYHHATKNGSTGFVIRDWQGTLLACGGKPLYGMLSPEHAEALACKQAVAFAMDNLFLPAIVETYSLLVQKQLISKERTNTSILGRIYEDLIVILEATPTLRVVHTRMNANKVAHILAAYCNSITDEFFYFSAPSFLQAALAAEVCNV